MRRLVCWLVFGWVGVVHAEVPTLPPLPGGSVTPVPPIAALPRVRNGVFDLRFVNVGQVVDLVYGDALHVPHVISSDVLQDSRVVSFQFDSSKGDLRAFVKTFLDSQGFAVDTRDGVDFISKKIDVARPADRATYVYQPRHRSAAYLSNLVLPLFDGASRAVMPSPAPMSSPASAPVGSSAVAAPVPPVVSQAATAAVADQFVFAGTAAQVEQVKALLPQLDTVAGEVVVRGWAYEVSDTDNTNSGFSIASKLLGVGVKVGEGSTVADSNALQFGAGRLSFAISALNADSRFRQVSSPNVRCVSGQQVRLNVGQQVPTVSSVSYQGVSGTPVQSIEYQDAGVIFNVTPLVMEDVIQLSVDEEISSFVSTTTGVSGSPTKNTRSLQTVANLRDGEVVVLGGLIQDSDTASNSRERFLPAFLGGHGTLKGRTEVVLVLQVQKI
ncbi:type II secretion system protein GspD [Paraburkholderia megapolitana]|uniref:Type II and III secretion system protein n=1 Tax=Paraburkholderia megapolitana TaxID=420953 RepID=A0A1I3G1M1_9BURK|nr:type II secretory pathway protein [Paraburkholderia megapolitana]QDQ82659.1 type II secretory pathway protein [Paraburkholderia megapolitana]SFI17395.1 type II and III secretion system protein [Paraburkholderia megapolitana]